MNELHNVHQSVLLQQVIDGLEFHPNEIFVDGTLGGGGHTLEVVKRFKNEVFIIGFDMDEDALDRARKALEPHTTNFLFVHDNFRNIEKVLSEKGYDKVHKVLLDLGLSSNQLELAGRGFSFQKDEPLLMTFKKDLKESDLTAKEILNTWEEQNIADVIYGYGEEQFSRRIAKVICSEREKAPIETTFQLVEIIKKATPFWYHFRKTHPATKTFQALRIAVNDEVRALEEGLKGSFEKLAIGGKIAVISFHSIEDRTVKTYFKKLKEEGRAEVSKKPIEAGDDERRDNPRSRSAKLRFLTKLN
jgi:16S rRNA (cytosine1402-N4)-methyltransferase